MLRSASTKGKTDQARSRGRRGPSVRPGSKPSARHCGAGNALIRAASGAEVGLGPTSAGALPDLDVRGAEVVRLARSSPATLMGSGKVEELKGRFNEDGIELVLVDGSVSPVQQRNLEKAWGVKVLDRTSLILEIFADRARTREGVLQVELAALSYQRTRLVRAWTHLERQRGGFGFVGGPGETQIESDRRAIDDQVIRLKRQLDKVVKTRELHRASRRKVPFPLVALVGYTNAGKSSLLNRLTGAGVLVENALFATLDPTTRRFEGSDGRVYTLTDTVGFVSHLPHQLVDAFKSTLEEVAGADLILHLVDGSHPEPLEQVRAVHQVIDEIGGSAIRELIVINKVDISDPHRIVELVNQLPGSIPISAHTGFGIADLQRAIEAALPHPDIEVNAVIPYTRGDLLHQIHERGEIFTEEHLADGTHVRALVDAHLASALKRFSA